ncbi:MAG: SH3 domain-containing protein [Candidatus Eisenbacteria bacterium]|nr:SH3 domain-containing protein [Candidatus Latescibacterota bacterium]MBD3301588.1 SH3 domain-containing protein [Candidatus Eisenbacteria bacterium]
MPGRPRTDPRPPADPPKPRGGERGMRGNLSIAVALLLFVQGTVPVTGFAQTPTDLTGECEVTASSLNIRSGAGTGNAVLVSVPRGTIVTVLEVRDGWAQIRLADGKTGWCSIDYLEKRTPPEPAEPSPSEPGAAPPGLELGVPDDPAGGGSSLGTILKWGSLAGAVAFGGLAYGERSKGNDAYDEYKTLFRGGDSKAADAKFAEVEDHDGAALTYAIVGGAFLGLFALQQFVLGGDESEEAADPPAAALAPSIEVDATGSAVRLQLVRASWE